ncbi:restriction endonuclease subunit R [Coleofasciculus chthonoplastes]|uniref:restriction endonuclease subunit R n=1 Tax=Coleofasciculus chthonoplastes TaxID=64178 RepID=UPI0032F9D602
MVQTIQSRDVTLRELRTNFALQLTHDPQFFPEWQGNLPEITELQQQQLDQVKAGYFNLLNYPPMLEGVVRMAILDPLLFIGGFYLAPFHIKAEKSVKIATEDEETIITGTLDVLVLKDTVWVMVIESKQVEFSIEAGLAQILSYMLANPNQEQPSFGMITTGGSFIFLKVISGESPQYGLSRLFSLLNPGNDLYTVLKILKQLAQF